MMKKYILAAMAAFMGLGLAAQKTTQEYADRYLLLSSKVGPAGLGIETLVNRWEADFPEDRDMLTAKFLYYYTKAQSQQVEVLDQPRYMGAEPMLTLKDSLGRDVRYFTITRFDDALFKTASETIDKSIRLNPDALDLRATKITSLIAYEGESPDMAAQNLSALIDYNAVSHPSWQYEGTPVDSEYFRALVQQYCYTFYRIGSPAAMEAFKTISDKMNGYFPKDTGFISNLGSYYFVYKQDYKTALKYYNKVLKLAPGDYAAAKNCVLLSRRQKDTKLEKKYLPMLISSTTDEAEKASAQVRYESLKNSKK